MAIEKQSISKYYLYIDECGDQNLENFNPSFPYLLYVECWSLEIINVNLKMSLTR